MKKSINISVIINALALFACVVVLMLRQRPDEPVAASVSDTSRAFQSVSTLLAIWQLAQLSQS